jgi:MFS transporter, NNP family, nitrate/nitrite transporter
MIPKMPAHAKAGVADSSDKIMRRLKWAQTMYDATAVTAGDRSRALWLSTIAFMICFAAWTIFSIIAVQIKKDLGLNDTQFGLLVGTPILTGSLTRLVLGIWTDQYGGRLVFTGVMLSAAFATWLLTFAASYPEFLLAALGIGIAGGSFAVGVTYVSKWYPQERQGTALGIFGSGNVGAAVTNFVAPFIMVAYGWKAVAQVWGLGLAVMAIVFWLAAKDDPRLEARKKTGSRREPLSAMLAPLKNLQVWRFSFYYFFSFGGFVALALWLPRYLIGAYGVDITTAGLLGATYTIPGAVFRILGGTLSDTLGARKLMYWAFIGSAICALLLANPPTDILLHGIHEPIRFTVATGVIPFAVLIFALGLFMSFASGAVFKHIPVYYPGHVGAVGGMVGLIGGLGGFVLPVAFGLLNDFVGLWQSCFMLLFILAGALLLWMHLAIRSMERPAQIRPVARPAAHVLARISRS